MPRAYAESYAFVIPDRVRLGEFNRPVLGDHVWATYNSFPDFYKKNLLEVYG
jgi:hypothetical protein